MSRTKAKLKGDLRVSDYISLEVMTNIIPLSAVGEALSGDKKETRRCRKLPLEFMTYYVVCLTLYSQVALREVQRCLIEGLNWLNAGMALQFLAGKSALSQARTRLGIGPMKKLFEKVCLPMAVKETRGAWYKEWRLVAIDGSTLDLPDEKENDAYFGRPSSDRGESAFPKLRFAALLEIGTRAVFAVAMDKYKTSEITLAEKLLPDLKPGMLCLFDRGFLGFDFYSKTLKTGADCLFRVKKNYTLPCLKRLPDGSFLSKLYSSVYERKLNRGGITVRVIEYRLKGIEGAEAKYILVTSILDWQKAPAVELAALYHERWEIEMAYDEMKTHLKAAGGALRSKTPDLVKQEFYGFMLAHYVIRSVMHQTALKFARDADTLSFIHAVRIIKRKIIAMRFPLREQEMKQLRGQIIDEIAQEHVVSSRGQRRQRALKRKIMSWPIKNEASTILLNSI